MLPRFPIRSAHPPGWRLVVRTALLFGLLASVRSAEAQFHDSFESPQATWRLAEADCGVRVTSQQRSFRDAHTGSGAENVQLTVGNGTYAYLVQSIGKAPVIPELAPSLWVKSDRPHLRMMVHVVFPRTIDKSTGRPVSDVILGDAYTDVGNWQQLHIKELAKQFDMLVTGRRTHEPLDPREAYIDLVILNVYSTPGAVDVWLDDLDIQGYVSLDANTPSAVAVDRPNTGTAPSRVGFDERAGSALQGSILTANGRPFSPRMIQHQGEPLEWLASLGFNAVKLSASPSAADLREAERLDLWLVAPPPYAEPGTQISPQYSRVLAWSLGSRLTDRDLAGTRQLTEEIRRTDPRDQRPVLCGVDSDFDTYSRQAGILLLDQPLLGSSFELAGYKSWLLNRARLMRPGTPFWAAVATQPAPRLQEQLVLFAEGSPPPDDIDLAQMRLAAYSALSAGARGLLFTSNSPLGIETPAMAQRTDVLKLLNYELRAIEPWLAGGSLVEDMATGDPTLHVSVWQTERSRLLLLTQHSSAAQYAAGPSPRPSISVVVPGVPIADRAYQITPGGLKQLRGVHGSGGIRITVEDPDLATAVVITQDPLVIHHLNRTLTSGQRAVAQLRHDVAARRLKQTTEIEHQLQLRAEPMPQATAWLSEAQAHLAKAQQLQNANDFSSVHTFTSRAEQLIARVRRGYWEKTAAAFPSPATSPCVSSFAAIPLHWQFADRIRGVHWGPNVLAGGDMESLDQLMNTGWRNQRRLPTGLESDVSLSLQGPHSGRMALRMRAWAPNVQDAPLVVERPLVWITSNSVPVRQGQIARIHGWVHVPAPLAGSHEGLVIFDSISGPDLGERIAVTHGWREFALYRAVPKNGELTLTFALTGLGEAWIDDVDVSLLDPDPIRPASPIEPPGLSRRNVSQQPQPR